jgi:hypothetical protein
MEIIQFNQVNPNQKEKARSETVIFNKVIIETFKGRYRLFLSNSGVKPLYEMGI